MSLPHKKGYATAEAAARSKPAQQPGATLVSDCPCGKVHVDQPKPAPKPLKAVTRSKPGSNSDIPDEVRAAVLERDGYRCVCCGRSIIGRRYSLGHRKRASQGGRPVPSNLIVLLGWGGEACHGRIDLYRDPEDAVKGYRVKSGQDPALIPVMVFSEHGSGATMWLLPDGTRTTEAPEGVAALWPR